MPEAAASIVGDRCLGKAAPRCHSTPDGLFVEDLRLIGSAPNGVGLLVDRLTAKLVVQDVTVEGYGIALEIGSTCPSCTVEIRDGHLQASTVGLLAGARDAVRGGVQMRNVTIDAARDAIHGVDVPGGLVMDRMAIMSSEGSGVGGVWVHGEAGTLSASNVSIEGFHRAINGNWSAMRLRNVEIACIFDAIYANNLPDFDADGLTIRDCMSTIPCEANCPYAAITLFGKLFRAGDTVRIRHANVTNYKVGVQLTDYRSVDLEDFVLAGGRSGLSGGPWGTLTMRRGLVAEHQILGVGADVDALRVERVVFDHNGFGDFPQFTHGGLIVNANHQALDSNERLAPLEIHNSSFTRNTPFGLLAQGDVFDASYNWWGSPLGPSPATPEAVGNPRTLGDMAAGQFVITEPHLTEPPPG